MRITSITGNNLELTEAIKSHIEKKLDALKKFTEGFEPVAEIRVEVAKTTNHHNKGPHFAANFTLSVPGTVLRAEEKLEDLYAAIDKATDDIKRQVKEYKEKLTDQNRGPRPDKV